MYRNLFTCSIIKHKQLLLLALQCWKLNILFFLLFLSSCSWVQHVLQKEREMMWKNNHHLVQQKVGCCVFSVVSLRCRAATASLCQLSVSQLQVCLFCPTNRAKPPQTSDTIKQKGSKCVHLKNVNQWIFGIYPS